MAPTGRGWRHERGEAQARGEAGAGECTDSKPAGAPAPQSAAAPSPLPPIAEYGFLSNCHTGALVLPPTGGSFEWLSERVAIWRPQGLQHSFGTTSVGGTALGGDTTRPTGVGLPHSRPAGLRRDQGPRPGAHRSGSHPGGGLGNFDIQWNTGQTDRKIMFPGPGDCAAPCRSHVRSGDRTVTKAIQVAPAPNNGFTAQQCPAGWEFIEVSVCYRREETRRPHQDPCRPYRPKGPECPASLRLGRRRRARPRPATERTSSDKRLPGCRQRRLLLRIRPWPAHPRADRLGRQLHLRSRLATGRARTGERPQPVGRPGRCSYVSDYYRQTETFSAYKP